MKLGLGLGFGRVSGASGWDIWTGTVYGGDFDETTGLAGAIATFETSLPGTITWSIVAGSDARISIDSATGEAETSAAIYDGDSADFVVRAENGDGLFIEVPFSAVGTVAGSSVTSPVILTAASGTFTVPAGVTSLVVYAFGAGADGQSGVDRPRGGAAGGYSKLNALTVTPAEVLNYQVAQAGTTDTTWFKTTGTVLANSANGTTGGSTTGAVGDVKTAGAVPGANTTGSIYAGTGGGGAPGPHGSGANGGGMLTSGDGGSGGGGADGGSTGGAGSSTTSGVGGNNRSATGGGAAATVSTAAGDGTDGGGGGGGDDTDTYSAGGNGSFETIWTDDNSSTSIGPGSGGGGAGNGGSATPVNPRVGGNGGPAAGGGGGRETGGAGGAGFIVVEWA